MSILCQQKRDFQLQMQHLAFVRREMEAILAHSLRTHEKFTSLFCGRWHFTHYIAKCQRCRCVYDAF